MSWNSFKKFYRFSIRRPVRFFYQRLIRGWDDSEAWSLDYSLAKLVLPRLIRFREITSSRPPDMTMEEWHKLIDQMISGFQFYAEGKQWDFDKEGVERADVGIKLFAEYYGHLWD